MKKNFYILISALVLFTSVSFAQFAEPGLADWDKLKSIFPSGASISFLSVSFFIVQAIFLIMRTRIGDLTGPRKFLLLSFLSVLVTIFSKLVSGENLISTFFDSTSLMAYQVLAHQAMKQFKEASGDKSNTDSMDSIGNDELQSEEISQR